MTRPILTLYQVGKLTFSKSNKHYGDIRLGPALPKRPVQYCSHRKAQTTEDVDLLPNLLLGQWYTLEILDAGWFYLFNDVKSNVDFFFA